MKDVCSLPCKVEGTLKYMLTVLGKGMEGHLMNGEFTIYPTYAPIPTGKGVGSLDSSTESVCDSSNTRLTLVVITQTIFWSIAFFYNSVK